MSHLLDYTFFGIILMFLIKYSLTLYFKYGRVRKDIDDGRLMERYIKLVSWRNK